MRSKRRIFGPESRGVELHVASPGRDGRTPTYADSAAPLCGLMGRSAETVAVQGTTGRPNDRNPTVKRVRETPYRSVASVLRRMRGCSSSSVRKLNQLFFEPLRVDSFGLARIELSNEMTM